MIKKSGLIFIAGATLGGFGLVWSLSGQGTPSPSTPLTPSILTSDGIKGGSERGGGDFGRGALTNVAHQREAPQIDLKSSDGRSHKLSDLRGSAVVIHFWASWCPPCLGEIPLWLEFAGRWKGRPVKFMAISLDKNWEDALKILPSRELPENVLSVLDFSQKLPDQFGTYQYPETYLVSPDSKIVSKWVGPQDWNNPEISGAIEQVLVGRSGN